MADNPPISTEAPETVTVDTGADQQTIQNLNANFEDFWAEQDSKSSLEAEPPPEAPEGAGQETKREAIKPEETAVKADVKLPETTPPPVQQPKESQLSDEEIDKMDLPPNAREDHVSHFRKMRDLWRADRARMRTEAERATKLENDLAEARRNALTPEVKADYEHAASVRRRVDFVSDPDFIQRYEVPIYQQYFNLLEQAVEVLPERNSARAWADQIKANYKPHQLNRDWWYNSVAAKIPGEMERQAFLGEVGQLIKLERERDGEVYRRSSDKDSFDNWIKEKSENTAKRVQEEIMTEIGIQEKRIQEVMPRNIDQAKTPEERRAIEKHNERFEKLNKFFKTTVHDLSANGPRAWVRASVEATRALILDEQLAELNEEVKGLRTERDRFKAELDKIHGVRRKLANTQGTPPAAPAKNNNLSVKDLDVRKAFDRYNWEQQ
jgi:hypothetical protein